MRIFHSLDAARREFSPAALTIGNFDGVHAGHRDLLRRVVRLAQESGSKPSVLTFHPHPTQIVAPARAPKLLTTPEERCELMSAEGIRQILILPFHAGIAALSPEDFFREVLIEALGVKSIAVGANFRFGRYQGGHVADLERFCRNFGVRVEVVPELSLRGVVVSSSQIRRLLASGDVLKAARLLGRPYSVSGLIVPGDGRGRKETVPTLNLETPAEAIPETGVYITRTEDLESHSHWNSISNIGYRPTFEGRDLTIETFLLAPLTTPPPARIRLEFLRRLRPEIRFDSAAALKQQILHDVHRASTFFRRTAGLG
jgi:riboflavin kinase/FMN adenylyltransferase